MIGTVAAWWAIGLMTGCAGGQSDSLPNGPSPFGMSTTGSPNGGTDDDKDDDDDDDDDDDGSATDDPYDEPETSGPGQPDDTAGDDTAGPGTATGPDGPDGGSSGGEDDEPFMPSNGQPDSGMYAHCYEPNVGNCTQSSPLCIQFDSEMNGFCTDENCVNPATDCNAAPLDATATPMCVRAYNPSMQEVRMCALDCSASKTCPSGMSCLENARFHEDLPTYSFCV